MKTISYLDKSIFYILCVFSLVFFINENFANQLIGLAVVLSIFRCMKKRIEVRIPKAYGLALAVFFGIMLLMIFLSPDMVRSAKEYWRYVNRMFPFIVALLFLQEKKKIVTVFLCLLVSMLIHCVYADYKGIIAIFQSGELYLRITGFGGGDVISFAGHLMLFLPILLAFSLDNSTRKWRKYFFLAFIIAFFALLVNCTRIAWLSMAAILPLIVCIYVENKLKLFFIALAAVMICSSVIYAVPFLKDRAASIADTGNPSNKGHLYIYQDSLKMVQDHALFGVGLGRFRTVFNKEYISEKTKTVEKYVSHTHNTTLMFLVETGIIGCAAFWFMYGSFLFYSGRSWIKEKCSLDLIFFLVTLTTLMQGITDYNFGLHPVIKIYFFLMALYLNFRRDRGSCIS